MDWRDGHLLAPTKGTILCRLTDIPDGEGREFIFGEKDDPDTKPYRILVVRKGIDAWAYRNQCAHFLVPLNVLSDYSFIDRDQIVCQVHYARYTLDTGECVRGDCEGERLISIPIRMDGDFNVIIDG